METMGGELITLLISVGAGLVITLVAVLLYNNLKKSRYDQAMQRAVLEDIRHSLERQIYGLNDRLLQNEERWKDVNHLLYRTEGRYLDSSDEPRVIRLSNFLKANGISENDLIVNERLIFVLTPFHSMWSDQFMFVQEVCAKKGFTCKRGDEEYFEGDIFPEILRLIAKSRLIIAMIDGRNPNVLYELGVAQALDKKVLLVSKDAADLPVDIKSQRFLIYNSPEDLKKRLNLELEQLG